MAAGALLMIERGGEDLWPLDLALLACAMLLLLLTFVAWVIRALVRHPVPKAPSLRVVESERDLDDVFR